MSLVQPQPPASPDYLQPQRQEPPLGSAKKIWLSTLVPLGTLLIMLIYIIADEKSGSSMTGSTFSAMLWLQGFITLGCWIFFCTAVNERLKGNTKVILMIFYPIVQAGVQFVLFFCGCLALFSLA